VAARARIAAVHLMRVIGSDSDSTNLQAYPANEASSASRRALRGFSDRE
jgi:hypothetical protein